LWEAMISFFMSVHPSACVFVCSHGTTRLPLDIHVLSRSFIFSVFQKPVEKIQVLLKSDKYKGHFTQRLICIYGHPSLIFSWNEKCFGQKLYRKLKHTFYVQYLFQKIVQFFWDNVEKCGRVRQAPVDVIIWCMCIAWWITKTTVTHSECVILTSFPGQGWLYEHVWMLCLFVHCPSCHLLPEHELV
jgi:hypothetical protein